MDYLIVIYLHIIMHCSIQTLLFFVILDTLFRLNPLGFPNKTFQQLFKASPIIPYTTPSISTNRSPCQDISQNIKIPKGSPKLKGDASAI